MKVEQLDGGVPNKEGANIHKYVQVVQFQYYLTSLASFAPNFS